MSRYDLDEEGLAAWLAPLPRYRARQLVDGLYGRLGELEDLGELPRALRDELAGDATFAPALEEASASSADSGETQKWLFRLHDGALVETVLMHHPHHSTVCVSSQAGCAMACSFCATGHGGFERQLTTGEIVEQVVRGARAARAGGRRLDHVVLMGMGEPLANYTAVLPAVRRMVGPLGLAQRHVTISTVGVVPGIRRLAREGLQVNLAVSLHAGNDALRDELVPLNKRYPLGALLEACRDYVTATRRRLSFEWALIDGVNDGANDAKELAALAQAIPLPAHVNLIPLNPTVGGSARGLAGSPSARVRAFRDALQGHGVNATVRRTRGRDIDAACGQLAGTSPVGMPTRR